MNGKNGFNRQNPIWFGSFQIARISYGQIVAVFHSRHEQPTDMQGEPACVNRSLCDLPRLGFPGRDFWMTEYGGKDEWDTTAWRREVKIGRVFPLLPLEMRCCWECGAERVPQCENQVKANGIFVFSKNYGQLLWYGWCELRLSEVQVTVFYHYAYWQNRDCTQNI